jgi:uncharacterized SAM-binding protein YcdF (DUF218 family)
MKRPRIKRILVVYLIVTGVLANVFVVWMAAGWPMGFDRWLVVDETPRRADYIVCLTGGTAGDNIPTEDGWGRIYTAVQLWFDGYAPKIVFTGGGTGEISESEAYAGFAGWFGCPEEALFFEPGAAGTVDHPTKLLETRALGLHKDAEASTDMVSQSAGTVGNKAEAAEPAGKQPAQAGLGIRRDTPLIIVTSPLHSRRAAMVFRKAGFTSFRMVTGWSALTTRDPAKVRALMTSKFEDFTPSGKDYGDVLNQLKWRTSYFFNALREYGAIAIYKIRGKA